MTTQDMHAKSNAIINNAVLKNEGKLMAVVTRTGWSYQDMTVELNGFQRLCYTYSENNKHQFTIFVKWYAEGYRVQGYQSGMEKYDFQNVVGIYDAVNLIKLISIAMKAGK